MVWNTVINILLNPDNLQVEIERRRQDFDQTWKKIRCCFKMDHEIANINKKMDILLDELSQGDFSRDVIQDRRRGLLTGGKNLK